MVRRTALIAAAIGVLVLWGTDPASAQDDPLTRVNALRRQVLVLMVGGEYDDALPLSAEIVALREKVLGPDHPDVAYALDDLASLYEKLYRDAEAEPLYRHSLAIREKMLGPDDPGLLKPLRVLAHVNERLGRFDAVEQLYQRRVAISETARGPDHPDVVDPLLDLANFYADRGRKIKAEPVYLRVLAIDERTLGPEHEDVASLLIIVGSLYEEASRFAEALPLLQRALIIREKIFEPEHEQVAVAAKALASLYDQQLRFAEAEPLLLRALAIGEKRQGWLSPDVVNTVAALTSLYEEQGRYEEAEKLAWRVVQSQEIYGPENSALGTSLYMLAKVYERQARYGEAEAAMRRALAIQEKALGADSPDLVANLNQLAQLYMTQGRYAEAEPMLKHSVTLAERGHGPNDLRVSGSLGNLASLYDDLGRHAEAEPLRKRAFAITEAALGPDHPVVAVDLNNLALNYQNQRLYADAEPLYRRALAIDEAAFGPDHPKVALVLTNLGALYRNQRRYVEAEPLLLRALAIRERRLTPDHPETAASLINLAALRKAQHRAAEAEPLMTRSLAIMEKAFGAEHPSVAVILENLAELAFDDGRVAEAERLLRRSLAIQEKLLGSAHPAVARTLTDLAKVHAKLGLIDDALRDSRRAVAILADRSEAAPTDSTSAIAEKRDGRTTFLLDVDLIERAGDPATLAETFRVAQLASVSSAGRAVAGMAARFAAGSDALAAVVRQRQDLADRRQRTDATLIKALGLPPWQRNATTEATLRGDLDAIEHQLEALDARIAAEFPSYAELSRPKPIEVGDAQVLLASDEVLLVYLVGEDVTMLWVLRRDGAAVHRIDIGSRALSAEVTALRGRLDPERNPNIEPFQATRAYALHQRILAPATPMLAGARQVFVVVDGALDSLPIGVLVTKPPAHDPETAADHRDIAWFARNHAVTVLPTVGALNALRRFAAATRAAAPFVGFGNPTLEGRSGVARGVGSAPLFRSGVADVDAVRRLTPLPETAAELRAVAHALGVGESELYLGARATEPVLQSAGLERYRVIEFATHGLMSGDLRGLAEPALVLTPPSVASAADDGLLTASEVATLKLDADWVVLSACNTAAPDGTPDAGGLSGLARAFFYAGARSLLVSHWSVPSQATVKLITGAFEALHREPGIGRAEALRRSMMAMIDDTSLPPEFAHPLAWGPFVLVGEGGVGR